MGNLIQDSFKKIGQGITEEIGVRRERRKDISEAKHQAEIQAIKSGKTGKSDDKKKSMYGF